MLNYISIELFDGLEPIELLPGNVRKTLRQPAEGLSSTKGLSPRSKKPKMRLTT